MKYPILFFLLLSSFSIVAQDVQKSTHEYVVKDGVSLSLDVYQTDNSDNSLRPVLVWVHGGGFSGGKRDNGMEVKLMETFAKQGYVGVSITYRLLRKGQATGFSCDCPRSDKINVFRESALDTWDALHFMYTHSDKFQIDPQKIIVGGSSAGAEAILNAVYLRDWLFEGPSKYDEIEPAAVFSLAGAVVDARYIGAHNAVPGVFFHGTKDNLVPYATAPHHYCAPEKLGYIWLDGSATIAKQLKANDGAYLLYTYVDARHEISAVQFDQLPVVFDFFESVFEGKVTKQEEVIVGKK